MWKNLHKTNAKESRCQLKHHHTFIQHAMPLQVLFYALLYIIVKVIIIPMCRNQPREVA